MKDTTLIYLLLGILAIATIVIISTLLVYGGTKKTSIKVELKRPEDFLYKSYKLFSKFFLTRSHIKKIKRHIENIELSDNWTINRRTMRFTYISLGTSIGLLSILAMSGISLYFFIIATITIYVVNNQMVRFMMESLDNKLLKQFEKFLGDVRHHYHGHGMMDEAIYDAIEVSSYEISLHANKMYEILTSTDVEEEIEKYNDITPNKFFRTFLALSYLVQKFGDKAVDGKSMFLSNLNYLKQEINHELLKREKLNYLFKSLSIIAITPIFFMKPLEKWAVYNLPELKMYYGGAYGFVVEIILFFIIIVTYQLISKMQNNTEEVRNLESKMEEYAFKIPIVNGLIERVVSSNYGKSKKLQALLKVSSPKTKVETFYLKSIMWSIIGFMVCLFMFLNAQYISRNNILYSSYGLKMGDLQINKEAEHQQVEFDRKYILMFSNKSVNYQDVETKLMSGGIEDRQLLAIATKRILEKIKVYNSYYFKWWQLIICLFIAVVFYYIPLGLVLFRKKVLQINMEDEVLQFHTIILMLMHIERIAVEDILRWMEEFAFIFKPSITKCLNNFEYGDHDALEELKMEEPYLPFVRLVENLQSASDKISIAKAFDELIIERGYYQEKRKQDNEIMVNTKGVYGKLIAFIPLGATIFLYLLLPFTLFSISQLAAFSQQVKRAL